MSRFRLFVGTIAFVAALFGGVALADWVVSSDGEGAAVAGSADSLVVSPGTPDDLLFPGNSADVAVTLENPNPFDVTVTSIVGDGPVTSTDANCQADGHQVTFADQTGTWEVPAGQTVDVMLNNAASMGTGAAITCQGANFLVPVTVAG